MKLPLIIATPKGEVEWRVLEADRGLATSETFRIGDEGFVRNDANAAISAD